MKHVSSSGMNDMGQAAFRGPIAGREALRNLRKRLNNPASADSTARALESLDRELFLKEYQQAYADLRNDPEAWVEVEAERSAFDGALMDGLEELEARRLPMRNRSRVSSGW
jgi:hypothetical protein